jgi:spermidine synthase
MLRKGETRVVPAVLVLGLSGIVAQTILLRELLILFSGNEYSLGVIFGFWVICEALGAVVGGKSSRWVVDPAWAFIVATILFSLIFPLSIYLIRIYKLLIGIPPDMAASMHQILTASLVLLLPAAFLHGLLFILATRLFRSATGKVELALGKAYFHETVGTIVGGLVAGFVFIPRFDSFQTALTITLLNAIICLLLCNYVVGAGCRVGAVVFSSTLIVASLVLAAYGADILQRASLQRQWQGRELIDYRNTSYQSIAVVRNSDQFTFYSDGVPVLTTPVPDIAFVEEFVHLPLLAQPDPGKVLVLGGGAGGVLDELLKYRSLTLIDYVEMDPELLRTIRDFPTPMTMRELSDPRVRIHFQDGRKFVRNSSQKYDIVLLGQPLPQTLQGNRYFTLEFFAQLRERLSNRGILALTAPGSLTYYNQELKDVNASLLATLGQVFPATYMVPGDLNLFMSSPSADLDHITAGLLAERLHSRAITTKLITAQHLEFRLDTEQRKWLTEMIQVTGAVVNRDLAPRGLFYNMAYRNQILSPEIQSLFNYARGIDLRWSLGVVGGFLLLAFAVTRYKPTLQLPVVIATTGFSGMVFELVIITGFQVIQGALFHDIAFLITAFMVGIAAGSLLMNRLLTRAEVGRWSLVVIETGNILLALLLWLLFSRSALSWALTEPFQVYTLFLSLLIAAGFLTGLEFPLVNRLQSHWSAMTPEHCAGQMYGADLAGGWCGGVLGGILLLPVLGVVDTCLLTAVLKVGSTVMVILSKKRGEGVTVA